MFVYFSKFIRGVADFFLPDQGVASSPKLDK